VDKNNKYRTNAIQKLQHQLHQATSEAQLALHTTHTRTTA